MNFYLNAVDELERQPDDEPTIDLVLCPGRNRTVTQWALRGIDTPVAVARYTTGDVTLTDETPATLRPALPELPELATELTGITEAADRIKVSSSTSFVVAGRESSETKPLSGSWQVRSLSSVRWR